ncbi:MAG: HAD family phosphatase [Chloroflexota bacterium]
MDSSSDQRPVTTGTAVIFDLDGVIVDSEIWWHEERVAWAVGLGLSWSVEDSHAVMGANSAGWARIMRERKSLSPDMEPEIAADIVHRMVDRYRSATPEIPDAIEAVRRIAADWPVAIASSAHRAVIDAALRATGLLDVVPIIVSSDEVPHGKPSPDVYLEAARRLGVPPSACIVVEDSINGIRSGLSAGMTVVLVPNASVPPEAGADGLADLVLDRLADLDPSRIRRTLRPGATGTPVTSDVSARHQSG